MARLARWVRYPRVLIAAGYVALILGAVGVGVRLEGGSGIAGMDVITAVAIVVLGIVVLHYAYGQLD